MFNEEVRSHEAGVQANASAARPRVVMNHHWDRPPPHIVSTLVVNFVVLEPGCRGFIRFVPPPYKHDLRRSHKTSQFHTESRSPSVLIAHRRSASVLRRLSSSLTLPTSNNRRPQLGKGAPSANKGSSMRAFERVLARSPPNPLSAGATRRRATHRCPPPAASALTGAPSRSSRLPHFQTHPWAPPFPNDSDSCFLCRL